MDPEIAAKVIEAYLHALSLRGRSLEPAQYDILRDLLSQWDFKVVPTASYTTITNDPVDANKW